jgi:hypothetical protein
VVAKATDDNTVALAYAFAHTIAYAEVLELALRVELLQDAHGYADSRQPIATDPRPDQLAHARTQLEVAALARRARYEVELEPQPPGARRPADVALVIEGQRLVVETRVILTSQQWRSEHRRSDAMFERIHTLERTHHVRCEGRIPRLLTQSEENELVRVIEVHARFVAIGGTAPPLRVARATLQVVRADEEPASGLSGPEIAANAWERIEQRIAEKADAARETGATWLRLDAYNGLWQFAQWAALPLRAKLSGLAPLARRRLRVLEGAAISSGSLQRQGEFVDEDVTGTDGTFGLRRLITPLRVRETLIIPADRNCSAAVAETWRSLYADEPNWLAWALDRVDLPSPKEIFGSA